MAKKTNKAARIGIRLDPPERAALEREAERTGKRLSTITRQIIDSWAQQQRRAA